MIISRDLIKQKFKIVKVMNLSPAREPNPINESFESGILISKVLERTKKTGSEFLYSFYKF